MTPRRKTGLRSVAPVADVFVCLGLLACSIAAGAEPPVPVVAPSERTVALPAPVAPLAYEVDVNEGGGFTVRVKGRAYRIESSYSYPHGGENRLVAGKPETGGEASWRAATEKLDEKTHRVQAQGQFYAVDRRLELQPTRIMVRDTIRNTSDDVVGIILSNHINTRGAEGVTPTMLNKLTAFVHDERGGVGILALDDLYQIQERSSFSDGLASLRTQNFGLDKGASYTVEWAVYPTATADYYDFINQVRKDEGLNRRVEGAFAFVPRRDPPSPETMDLLNLKYTSLGCLGKPPDDPAVSLEGFEFAEYPQECRLIKQTFAETKKRYPGVRVMFHVAHGLYACNNPEERFPDSRVLRADGKQIMYGGNDVKYYEPYFSKERVDAGWRWYIFYPTLENRFGKAMIRAMEYMVDELGATGMWADGFLSGYAYVDGADGYSYDRWDGHSVDIDPQTKLVTRKKTCVAWASLPVLKKVVQIIAAKGGVTITNEGPDYPMSRAFWKEDVIASCEGSPDSVVGLQLSRAPCSLSSAATTAEASYLDILAKLDRGSLYYWYSHSMDHKTLVEHMYPIEIESIHAGTIRGRDRIVTKNSGTYGWPGDRALHVVYRYDARGNLAGNDFLSTVDPKGVCTEVRLAQNESAAVVKIPVTIESPQAVNVNVRRYDAGGIEIAMNGGGEAKLRVAAGTFAVTPGAAYRVTAGTPQRVTAGNDATLEFALSLAGATTVTVEADRGTTAK
ncbi:MAG: hypothetical protein NTW96_06470 [Planctomycetia bacterium]|nr:hypothetical protein [Planctomycetia bacterium]